MGYDDLAPVYEFLVPEDLLAPAGSYQAFRSYLRDVPPGAPILDCACGPGHLAVGLAQAGFAVTATDASEAMTARAGQLAADCGVAVTCAALSWDQLGRSDWQDRFAVVFCVGNSLTHAEGEAGRRSALRNMIGVLQPGGRLVLTSRNWERVRAAGSSITVADRVAVRAGRRAIVIHYWALATDWHERHGLDVAVALLDDADGVTTTSAALAFWPFRHQELVEDLHAVGLAVETTTYNPEVERYLVTARRAA